MARADDGIVTCPACGRRYRLPREGGPRPGQRLRCGHCRHVFPLAPPSPPHAAAEDHPPSPPRGEPAVAAGGPIPAEDGAREHPSVDSEPGYDSRGEKAGGGEAGRPLDDAPQGRDGPANHAQDAARSAESVLAALRARQARRGESRSDSREGARRRRLAIAVGWLCWLGFVAFLLWLVLWAPPAWRAAVPGLSPAHALLAGHKDRSGLGSLAIILDDQGRWEETADGWRVTVTGRLRNDGAGAVVAPPVVVMLRDAHGRPRAKAIARLSQTRVPARGSIAFSARLEPVPHEVVEEGALTVVAQFAAVEPRGKGGASSSQPGGGAAGSEGR